MVYICSRGNCKVGRQRFSEGFTVPSSRTRAGRIEARELKRLAVKVGRGSRQQLVDRGAGRAPLLRRGAGGTGGRRHLEVDLRLRLSTARPEGDPGLLAEIEEQHVAAGSIRRALERAESASFIAEIF